MHHMYLSWQSAVHQIQVNLFIRRCFGSSWTTVLLKRICVIARGPKTKFFKSKISFTKRYLPNINLSYTLFAPAEKNGL